MRGAIRISVIALTLLAAAAPAQASRVFALTDTSPQRILSFDTGDPGHVLSDVPVSGLQADEVGQAIDSRPTNGRLYLLAAKPAGNARLMQVDPETGAVSSTVVLTAAPGDDNPFTGLSGDGVGASFNPVTDFSGSASLRIVTNNDENLRVNATNGQVTTDTAINPALLSLVASAYTNNDPYPATGTDLYAFDLTANSLFRANNANAGTYNDMVGPGIVPADSNVGLDISTIDGGTAGAIVSNAAYASATVGSTSALYRVNLTDGLFTFEGAIGDGSIPVKGIALRDNLIAFASPAAGAGEAGGNVALTIRRARAIGSSTVAYEVTGGSASGSDFSGGSGSVTFGPGETSKTVSLAVADDGEDENDESLVVSLSDATPVEDGNVPGYVVAPKAANVTIADNDTAAPAPPPGETPLPGPCDAVQNGSAAEDALIGGNGGDRLIGRSNSDALFGGLGDDCLFGNSGNDFLVGGDGNDRLRGGSGSDFESGGPGNDSIVGGSGNDTLSAGAGLNNLTGGRGADLLLTRNGTVETVNCGSGRDRASVDRTDRVLRCERVSRR